METMKEIIADGHLYIAGVKVAFLCDRKKECNSRCDPCIHTTEVEHAANFEILRNSMTNEITGIIERERP